MQISFQKMGDKIEAKRIAKKCGLPIIEGSEGGVKSVEAKILCKKLATLFSSKLQAEEEEKE